MRSIRVPHAAIGSRLGCVPIRPEWTNTPKVVPSILSSMRRAPVGKIRALGRTAVVSHRAFFNRDVAASNKPSGTGPGFQMILCRASSLHIAAPTSTLASSPRDVGVKVGLVGRSIDSDGASSTTVPIGADNLFRQFPQRKASLDCTAARGLTTRSKSLLRAAVLEVVLEHEHDGREGAGRKLLGQRIPAT